MDQFDVDLFMHVDVVSEYVYQNQRGDYIGDWLYSWHKFDQETVTGQLDTYIYIQLFF